MSGKSVFKIWVDADACPKVIKNILYRAAQRLSVKTILVANKNLHIPSSEHISMIKVGAGFDVADNEIVQQMGSGDLVITADIPLAALVIEKGGFALNPRGELYTEENVQERLSMRNFMDELRSTGIDTGGPAAIGNKDREKFANQLDRFLTEHCRT